MTHEEKKAFINGKIREGDKRSYNEINADLELHIWQENKSLPMFNSFSVAKNNRKRTKGRIVQSIPLYDKPTGDNTRKIVGYKQLKHQLPIKQPTMKTIQVNHQNKYSCQKTLN